MRREPICTIPGPAIAGLLLCLALLLQSAPADAYHTEQEHLTDQTAWTLAGDKGWRLGLFKAEVGLGDRVALGTYTLPWAAGATNGYVKWRFYAGDVFNWAAQATYFRVDTASFFPDAKDPPVFGVGTFSVLSSLRFSAALHLSNSLEFNAVRGRGKVDSKELGGALQGGLTNVQYVGALEWRWSRTTALVITARYLMAQVADLRTSFTARPDEYTTVDVRLNAEEDRLVNFRGAFSIVPKIAWSWQTFNLELGLGYGNPNLPGVNIAVPIRSLIPAFDLYWTF